MRSGDINLKSARTRVDFCGMDLFGQPTFWVKMSTNPKGWISLRQPVVGLCGLIWAVVFMSLGFGVGCNQPAASGSSIERSLSPCEYPQEVPPPVNDLGQSARSQVCEPVVVVRRHAPDAESGSYRPPQLDFNSYWEYPLLGGNGQVTPWRRLTEEGDRIAQYFGSNLGEVLAAQTIVRVLDGVEENRHPCPIDRVITIDPTSPDDTQNPFETAYPFIIEQEIAFNRLSMVSEEAIRSELSPESFLGDSGGSTLVVATREALWARRSDGELAPQNRLMGRLVRSCDSAALNCGLPAEYEPQKDRDFFIFSNFCELDQRYEVQKVEFEGQALLLPASTPLWVSD